ncbi:hypothetical protein [Maribacter sp. 2210JD10-5]|uniref:hypothetical protein n=1 Tax=Maribacter sp. 2210JD10-5 TaxID=3386272 RepID=UPI0039BCCA95
MEFPVLTFLRDNFYVFLYGLTLIFSLFSYKKYFDTVLRFLPAIITYTFLTELLGNIVWKNENFQLIYEGDRPINNSIVYNIHDIVFYGYFFYIFWLSVENKRNKKIIKYGSIIFIAISIINPFFESFFLYPQTYSIAVGSLLLIACIVFYLIELNKNFSLRLKKSHLLFWISLGLLVFYPFYPIIMYIGTYHNHLYTSPLKEIHIFLICAMYFLFIIGFIKMRRMKPLKELS